MIIRFHRQFKKQYERLPVFLQEKVEATLILFEENPHHPRLRNHALLGTLKGHRAFSVSQDLRVVFIEENDYTVVLLLEVGTHAQVYE